MIEPGLLALHQTRWEPQQVRRLLDFAKSAHNNQRDDGDQSKPGACPAPLGCSNATCHQPIDKKDHGQATRDRHDLEVLDIQIASERAVGGSRKEAERRTSEDRGPGRVDVGEEVAEEPSHTEGCKRSGKENAPG